LIGQQRRGLAAQLAHEVDESPFVGTGLKALAKSKINMAITPVADRAAPSGGVRGNRRAAVPLACEGDSTTYGQKSLAGPTRETRTFPLRVN